MYAVDSCIEHPRVCLHMSEMNALWKKVVSDVEFFKYFLYFHHQFSSSPVFLPKLLKVHCVGNVYTHLNLVYVFNVLHY